MKILSILLSLLLSCYVLMGCNSNSQGANSQDEPKKERTERPQAPTNDGDSNTVATPTGSKDAEDSLKRGNPHKDTLTIEDMIVERILNFENSFYETTEGIKVSRGLIDFLQEGEYAPFHGISRNGKIFLFFDNGEDLNDDIIKRALTEWPTMQHSNFVILIDPKLEEIKKIPSGIDFAILNGRPFPVWDVRFSTKGWY